MSTGISIRSIREHILDLDPTFTHPYIAALKARGCQEPEAISILSHALVTQFPEIESVFIMPNSFNNEPDKYCDWWSKDAIVKVGFSSLEALEAAEQSPGALYLFDGRQGSRDL